VGQLLCIEIGATGWLPCDLKESYI
jgi:hypothetical protein